MSCGARAEHRIGLKPILRRVLARKGSRVGAIVQPLYQWMYLYGFVQPESGKTSWLLMPTVNATAFSLALSAFAQEQEGGPNKHLLVVMDQAGWHKSRALLLVLSLAWRRWLEVMFRWSSSKRASRRHGEPQGGSRTSFPTSSMASSRSQPMRQCQT